jgi:hypothetical protein
MPVAELSLSMMHTRRTSDSPPTSTEEHVKAEEHAKADWTPEDIEAFIDFLIEHKAEAGDGANFKPSVWSGSASEMAKHTTKGAQKSAAACKSKWAEVHTRTS